MGKDRYWMPRKFIDEYAVKLSPYTHSVYSALCRYADAEGFVFWGCRRLAEKLGINKSTAAASIRELIVYGLVVRGVGKQRRVSGLYIKDVRYKGSAVSALTG